MVPLVAALVYSEEAAQAMSQDCAPEPLRQRFCRAQGCGARFFLCRACDRGQCYCCLACRAQARTQQRRAARRRHQHSAAGRLDHRDRQRAYRRRLAQRPPPQTPPADPPLISASPLPAEKNVTDHTSQTGANSGIVRASAWRWPASAQPRLAALGALVCRWCGRVSRWLNPFAQAR